MEQCKTCHGNCCRRHDLSVWGSDIMRICDALNVDMFFFTDLLSVEKENAAQVMKESPVFIFTDSGEEKYYSLIMKTQQSKYHRDTKKCLFLREWDARLMQSEELKGIVSRCGIYGLRPISCRAWPVEYDAEKDIVKIPDSSSCQVPEEQGVYGQQENNYAIDAILCHHEKLFFMQVAEKWNQAPDVSDNFYKFLKKEYNNRVKHIKE